MKNLNYIAATALLIIFIGALCMVDSTPSYKIHKTRSGDFIIIDKEGANNSRIYELVELPTNRVSEAVK
jgi:hypothetical protein